MTDSDRTDLGDNFPNRADVAVSLPYFKQETVLVVPTLRSKVEHSHNGACFSRIPDADDEISTHW